MKFLVEKIPATVDLLQQAYPDHESLKSKHYQRDASTMYNAT
jgi:hypothetical protein